MPNFQEDLKKEKILSAYMDKVYDNLGFDYERIIDDELQHQGVDLIINHSERQFFIDEKAQLHHLNSDLPTFTFELSYLNKKNVVTEGWLLDKNKKSDYYFLITCIKLKNRKSVLTNANDIVSLKISSVNRYKLLKHLDNKGLTKSKLLQYDKEIRDSKKSGLVPLTQINQYTQGAIYVSDHLKEKPINLQLRLEFLSDLKIAKSLVLN